MDTIFIDIDGVVADSIPWWMSLYNVDNFTSFQKSDLTTYDPRDCLGISLQKYYEDYRGVQVVEGAKLAIIRLSVYYEVVFVTVGFGEYWLRAQGFNQDIIHIKNRKHLRGLALIDDYEDNLDQFNGERFLIKQPWTEDSPTYKAYTWAEITEVLLERVNAS